MRRAVALLLLLAACKPDYSPNTYASNAVQQAAKVDQGIVVGVRRVAVSANAAAGTAAGAAAGAALGASAPGSGVQSTLTAIGGGLIGATLGAGIEHASGDTTAFEYIVRKENGDLLSVTQIDVQPLAYGQRVLAIAGAQARIVPDYTARIVATPTGSAGATTATAAPVAITLPSQGGPSQGGPSQGGPSQGGPSQGGPSQGGPSQGGPPQDAPTQEAPTLGPSTRSDQQGPDQ